MTEPQPEDNKNPDKQKKSQKKVKKKALKQFLKSEISPSPTTTTTTDLTASTILSDQQQKVVNTSDQNNCYLCMVDLGDKKRVCGFCNMPACSEHMRKKRKNREIGRNVRICDDCEDRYLYSKYMKLEFKNQESLSVQESIIQAQKDELQAVAKQKRDRLAVHKKKQSDITLKRKTHTQNTQQQQSTLKTNTQKTQKLSKQLQTLAKQVKKIQQNLPPLLQDDYRALQLELEKVKKQIIRYEKLCIEAGKAKTKRQKEILQQYNKWEEAQRAKLRNQSGKNQGCRVF